MSDGSYASGASESRTTSRRESSVVDAAKDEAADLRNTATDTAKDLAGTVKEEASSVAHEAKIQAQDLFDQARHELSEQAASQQSRIAAGLGALGDELGSMARNSDGSGIAADLVQRVSERASSAATWLGSRDPAGVLDDVKVFARRRPVFFIGAALVAGVVAGRLTRALVANSGGEPKADGRPPLDPPPATNVDGIGLTGNDTPLYSDSAARFDGNGTEASRERSDTL